MFRIIPIILLGIMTMYFYTALLRINSWGEFNFSKLVVIIILLLIMIPGINIFGIWFLILLHLFEIGIVIEILNLILKKIDLKGWSFLYNSFSLPILLTFLLFCYGYYNINNIKRVEYNIFTEKNISEKGYKIGFISDIHYGNSLNMEKLEKVVEKLNKENLDFLILGGDIVDEGTTLQGVKEVFKILGKIKNRYGLYFIYGNHDMSRYTKKPNYTLKELKEAIGKENIYILEDKGIDINEDINLVGRKDRIFKNKKDSEELIKEVDKNKYIIVVSHQPTDLEKNSKLGYNLQISGHTHNGQIFPFNLLIKFFNLAELIYGQKEFENFNVIVTSGLSGWGYPIRTAGNSDILADYFLKGAEESQNIVEKVSLVNKKIEFCKGCLSCQNTGKCIIKDDANEIIEKIKNSDVVVFSTPIYFYEMAGQMKTLLDRTNPLFPSEYQFKDIYLLATAADTDERAIDRAIMGLEGWIECFENSRLKGVVRGVGADVVGSIKRYEEKLREAYELGKNV